MENNEIKRTVITNREQSMKWKIETELKTTNRARLGRACLWSQLLSHKGKRITV
jgi:hypothetical protein